MRRWNAFLPLVRPQLLVVVFAILVDVQRDDVVSRSVLFWVCSGKVGHS